MHINRCETGMIEGRSHLHMSVYALLAQYRYRRPGAACNHRRLWILAWIECQAWAHSGLPPITEPFQFLIGAFGGALALVYLELVKRTWSSIKIRAKRQWGSTIIRQLSDERAALYDLIEEMRAGLDLPGDVLSDGRVGTRPFALDPDDMP